MPSKEAARLDASVKNAEKVLRRADQEQDRLQGDLAAHAKCLGESANLAARIATTESARLNLAKLSLMAVKLEGVYGGSSQALREYAATSDELRTTNLLLSLCYAAVTAGKVMDVVASVTGVGKWVSSAKTSILDVAEAAQKGDETSAQAGGVNLALIAARETEVLNGAAELQAGFAAFFDLTKDLRAILSAKQDLAKVKADLGQWTAKVGEKVAKLTEAAGKTIKLYETYQGLMGKLPKPAFEVVGKKAYAMRLSDYFSAVKSGIEAAVNLYQTICSILDTAESWKASAAANEQADRQLGSLGTGGFDLDLAAVAGLSPGGLVGAIQPVSSAPDARQLAYTTGMKAKDLARDAEELARLHRAGAYRIGSLKAAADASVRRIEATDKELRDLRPELERQRELEPLRVAVALDLIDRERKLIREALGGR